MPRNRRIVYFMTSLLKKIFYCNWRATYCFFFHICKDFFWSNQKVLWMLKVLPREVIGVPLDSDSVVVLLSVLLGSMVLNGFLGWSGIWRISLSRATLNRVKEETNHPLMFQPPALKQNFLFKRKMHSQNDSESSVVVVWSRVRALRRFKRLLSSSAAKAFCCLTSDCFTATTSFYKDMQKGKENQNQVGTFSSYPTNSRGGCKTMHPVSIIPLQNKKN